MAGMDDMSDEERETARRRMAAFLMAAQEFITGSDAPPPATGEGPPLPWEQQAALDIVQHLISTLDPRMPPSTLPVKRDLLRRISAPLYATHSLTERYERSMLLIEQYAPWAQRGVGEDGVPETWLIHLVGNLSRFDNRFRKVLTTMPDAVALLLSYDAMPKLKRGKAGAAKILATWCVQTGAFDLGNKDLKSVRKTMEEQSRKARKARESSG